MGNPFVHIELSISDPSMWMAYVQVDNLGAATKKAEQLGAKVMKEKNGIARLRLVQHDRRPGRRHACALGSQTDEELERG